MNKRIIDEELSLISYYPNYEETIKWYQDLDLCKQIDNIDYPYTMERLVSMYTYLDTHGKCFYIEYQHKLIGDITLQDNGDISIVIIREYQNRHIGRRCIGEIIKLAKESGFKEISAEIYDFNTQSQMMFSKCGFIRKDNRYIYHID